MSSYIDFLVDGEHSIRGRIDDQLYDYMEDTFCWVKGTWLDGSVRSGFDYVGITEVVDEENIFQLCAIMQAWRQLFSCGPEKISIAVGYTYGSDPTDQTIDFTRPVTETFFKTEIIAQLDSIIAVCDKAIKENERVIVMGL